MRVGSRLTLAVLLTLVGCSKRVDGPTPAVEKVAPQVVCDAQRLSTVTITGTNLTPMPIRTLTDVPSLELPALALTRSEALNGAAVSGTAIAIPDSPDEVGDAPTHRARWQSETSMAFDVTPELALADGVYDLTVTNPDGQAVTLSHALAAVPPPALTGAQAIAICDAQAAQTITLSGTGFLKIGGALPSIEITNPGGPKKTYTPSALSGCAPIAASVQSGVEACTSVAFVVPRQDLAPGSYTLVLSNPAPANCVTTQPLAITVNAPPTVADNSPKTICAGGGAVGVTGTGFIQTPSVALGSADAGTSIDAGTVTYTSATQVTATFGDGTLLFTPGLKYDLTLTNPDGCNATLPQAVTAVPGPSLFFVDPPVVFNGITTQVTIYTTSVTGTANDLTVTITQRSSGTKTTLTGPRIDTAHPKRILVNVPKGQAKGEYDVTVLDLSGCPATLQKGLTVVDQATVALTGVSPSFGWQNGTTAVKITASSGLIATPRAYLSPHTASAATTATALSSVAFSDATLVTAIVPQGVDPAANPYDLIVVNPDGTVGVLQNAYKSQASEPPVITGLTPQSIEGTATVPVTISGTNFRGTTATSNPPSVVFTCITNTTTGATQDFTVVPTSATATSLTVPTTALGVLSPPSLCTIKVINAAAIDPDQPFATFEALAISGSSGNLTTPGKAGANLPEARRGLALVSNGPTSALRFLYALGGDTGTATTASDKVFTVSADQRGTGTAWFTQRYRLTAPRTLGAAATLGRYLYLLGGNDGTGPVKTVERALVLDPLQAPGIADVDIIPGGGTGLSGGIWTYRVAALMDAADADNPGGETLPSDVQVLQLPELSGKLQVKLTWSQVTGAVGYVIYRSKDAGTAGATQEYLDQVTGGATLTYTDTGKTTDATKPAPLAQGSTGAWKSLPDLTVNREATGAAIAQDPSAPATWYLYAMLGKDVGALASYEYLPLTVSGSGQQTYPVAPATTWTSAASGVSARSQHSTYTVTHANASRVTAGDTFLYLGGGTANGTSAIFSLDVGKVTAGGALGAVTSTGATIKSFGQGSAAAANFLFAFGDDTAAKTIVSGQIDSPPPTVANVNNNGSALATGRYLPGTVVEGALIYLAGGSNSGKANATNAVEWFVY